MSEYQHTAAYSLEDGSTERRPYYQNQKEGTRRFKPIKSSDILAKTHQGSFNLRKSVEEEKVNF